MFNIWTHQYQICWILALGTHNLKHQLVRFKYPTVAWCYSSLLFTTHQEYRVCQKKMVILELLQFAFLALIIILPFSCIAYIAIKMGWCENKPGNCISAVFSYTACCLTACISLCQRSRRNTEASETVWTPCCSPLLTQAQTLACPSPIHTLGLG